MQHEAASKQVDSDQEWDFADVEHPKVSDKMPSVSEDKVKVEAESLVVKAEDAQSVQAGSKPPSEAVDHPMTSAGQTLEPGIVNGALNSNDLQTKGDTPSVSSSAAAYDPRAATAVSEPAASAPSSAITCAEVEPGAVSYSGGFITSLLPHTLVSTSFNSEASNYGTLVEGQLSSESFVNC